MLALSFPRETTCIINVIVAEKPTAVRTRRRTLHLHWEPAARVHAIGLTVGVRDLCRIDRVERDADAHPAVPFRVVFYEDEFALAGFRDVAEEGGVVIVVVVIIRALGSAGGGGYGMRRADAVEEAVVQDGCHGWTGVAAEGGGGRVGGGIAGEGVVRADVIAAGGCVVVMLLLFDITIVNCEERHHISLRTFFIPGNGGCRSRYCTAVHCINLR